MDRSELARQIRRAVYDPNAIVGRRYDPSWGEGKPGYRENPESIWDWIIRAVMEVLKPILDRAHIPTLAQGSTPGTWMVHCAGCSDAAQDYVHPCTAGHWDVPAQLVAAHRLDDARAQLGAWEKTGEAISHHIPDHYEAGEGAFMSIVQDWADDAARVVDAGQAWRKRSRRTPGTCGCHVQLAPAAANPWDHAPICPAYVSREETALDAAVEKIYPSEDYL